MLDVLDEQRRPLIAQMCGLLVEDIPVLAVDQHGVFLLQNVLASGNQRMCLDIEQFVIKVRNLCPFFYPLRYLNRT